MSKKLFSNALLIAIAMIAAVAAIRIISLGYFMNALPVSQSRLSKLSSEHVDTDVEDILGLPTYKYDGVWIYSRSKFWTKVRVFFDTDGHFSSYEIDY